MTDPILSVVDLKAHFRTEDGLVKAVDGVSFELNRGEVLGVVGESGSGKSVMSLALMGLIPRPSGVVQGEVRFAGKSLFGGNAAQWRSIRGKRIAMIFQDPMTSLNPYLTVARQLTEVLEAHERISHADARARSIEMLGRVGIADPAVRIDSYPHELSGGMRQRVMIAMALLCKPEILIADEPTTALDVTIQAQILDLIRDLQTDLGTSVIMITHDLGVIAGMANRVAVMYAGRIVEFADTVDLFARPKHPYTQGLLASIPRLDRPAREPLSPIPGRPPDLSALPSGCPFRVRCDRATQQCAEQYPTVVEFPHNHWAACWEAKP